MTTTTSAPAQGKPGMDLSGQGLTAEAIGFTGIPPVHKVAAELFIADHARDLAEQREVTEALGLDQPLVLAATPEPRPRAVPDPFRRSTKSRGRGRRR
jgi:hypothetical protein